MEGIDSGGFSLPVNQETGRKAFQKSKSQKKGTTAFKEKEVERAKKWDRDGSGKVINSC